MRRTQRLPAAIRVVREAATVAGTPARPRRVRLKTPVADLGNRTGRRGERPVRRRRATGFPGEAGVGEVRAAAVAR